MKTILPNKMDNGQLPDSKNSMTPFGLLAIICVAIPGFAAWKGLFILAAWIYLLATRRLPAGLILWFFSVFCNLAMCYEVALFHEVLPADLFNQLTRLLLFFVVLSIGVMTINLGVINSRRLDSIIFGIASLSATLKIGILAIALSGWYSLDAVQSAFGFETVSDNIGLGLLRLQFPSDIILVFLIACYKGGRNKAVDLLLMFAATVIVLLSYSRYLFSAYVLCIILRFYRARRLDTVSRAAILLGAFVLLLFSASLVERFAGEGTTSSDETRTLQIKTLTGVIMRHFAFGTGIGSSVNGFKRSDTLPFSYEVEWYALTMQLGLVGLSWFMGNLLAPLLSSIRSNKGRAFLLSIFAIWALAGFTNPYVTSLGSAFGFCILMLSVAADAEYRSQLSAMSPMPWLS